MCVSVCTYSSGLARQKFLGPIEFIMWPPSSVSFLVQFKQANEFKHLGKCLGTQTECLTFPLVSTIKPIKSLQTGK